MNICLNLFIFKTLVARCNSCGQAALLKKAKIMQNIFVDQYHPWLLVAIMLLAVLSLSDGIFTLHLIEHGATKKTRSWLDS